MPQLDTFMAGNGYAYLDSGYDIDQRIGTSISNDPRDRFQFEGDTYTNQDVRSLLGFDPIEDYINMDIHFVRNDGSGSVGYGVSMRLTPDEVSRLAHALQYMATKLRERIVRQTEI
jgi:hypothetical protein